MPRPVREDDDIATDQLVHLVISVEDEVGLTAQHQMELCDCCVFDPKAPWRGELRAAEDHAAHVDAPQGIGEVICWCAYSVHADSVGRLDDWT